MLELQLDEGLAEFCSDGADARTRVALLKKKPLSSQLLQDFIDLGDQETLRDKIEEVFKQYKQYRKERNPYSRITDPLKAIIRKYRALVELGVNFDSQSLEAMGNCALETVGYGSPEANLFREIDLQLVRQYINACDEEKKAPAVIFSVEALNKAERTAEIAGLYLSQEVVLESLERILLPVPYPQCPVAQVDCGNSIVSVEHKSIRMLAELIDDKDVLKKMVQTHLQEQNAHVSRLIHIAAATGDFVALEAYSHTRGLIEEGVLLKDIYEVTRAPHLVSQLEAIAWKQVQEPSFGSYSKSIYPLVRTIVQLDDTRLLAIADHKLEKALPEMEKLDFMAYRPTDDRIRNQCRWLDGAMSLYESTGMSKEDIRIRILNKAIDHNALSVALNSIVPTRDHQARYRLGLKYAEQRDYAAAFIVFVSADLEHVPTNDRLFYETVARRIVPGLVAGIPPEHIKRKVNSMIKRFLIRDIKATEGDYVIDFGVGVYQVSQGQQEGISRNSVQTVTYGYLERDVHKKHQREDELRVERFWLNYLSGKAPVKRILGTRGDVLVLETSHGIPLLTATAEVEPKELQSYLHLAAEVAAQLYTAINSSDNLVERLNGEKIEFHLDKAAIDLRFDRFFGSLANTKLKGKVRAARERVIDYLLAHKQGIIHADFSPRNLMVEDGGIIVVDHENYREGHPIAQVVSLIIYPYAPHDSETSDFTPVMDKWAHTYDVGREDLEYQKLFWSIRQAGAIAGKPALRRFYDFFIQEVEKVV